MKNILLRFCAFAVLFISFGKWPNKAHAQDIHFSQFYMAPLLQNPAMAGALFDTEALINYKNQWKSMGSPYSTVAASYDMKLNQRKYPKGFFAAGINLFSDKAGDGNLGTTQAALSVAYHIKISEKSMFGAGIQGGIVQRSVNFSSLSWGSQYDGNSINTSLTNGEPTNGSTKTAPDFSGGVLWNYDNSRGTEKIAGKNALKANLGFSVFHLNQPNIAFYNNPADKLNMKFVLHGNALIAFPGKFALVPGFMFYKQGDLKEVFIGSMVRYKSSQESKSNVMNKGAAVSLGAYYRAKDAIAISMLLEYSHYAIGVSYDVNTSQLKTVTGSKGGLEISLRFVTPNPFTTKTAATRL